MARSPSDHGAGAAARGRRGRRNDDGRRHGDDVPVLPERVPEDREEAWGDSPASRDEHWYRRERPPHHE